MNLATRGDQSTLKSSHPRTSEGPWHPPIQVPMKVSNSYGALKGISGSSFRRLHEVHFADNSKISQGSAAVVWCLRASP